MIIEKKGEISHKIISTRPLTMLTTSAMLVNNKHTVVYICDCQIFNVSLQRNTEKEILTLEDVNFG